MARCSSGGERNHDRPERQQQQDQREADDDGPVTENLVNTIRGKAPAVHIAAGVEVVPPSWVKPLALALEARDEALEAQIAVGFEFLRAGLASLTTTRTTAR